MAEDIKKESRGSPEEEIRELEMKLEEKKRELREGGASLPEEKELFRGVLREHIEEAKGGGEGKGVSVTPPPVVHKFTDDTKKKKADEDEGEEQEEEIRRLVEVALTKGIREAVKIAQAESPYILDELHDHLVDDYYDKLVALRMIQEF